jgi:molybdopterin biosynthesis enzyme
MMGDPSPDRPVVRSVADTTIRRGMGDEKQHLIRVAGSFGDDGRFHVTPTGAQGSHQLAKSAAANGIAFVADGEVVGPGDEVSVLFLG